MTYFDWTVEIDGVDVSQFVKAGGTIDSGRPSFFTDFMPPRAVFEILTPLGWPQYAGTWPTIDYDMPVIIHVTWDGTTQWRRFTGTVQAIDLGVYAHRITCMHPVGDLEYVTSGGTGAFYERIAEPDLERVPWLASEASSAVTINVVGTNGRWVTKIDRDTRATPILPQLLALAESCDARLRGTRLGDIDYRARVWTRPARYTLPDQAVARDTIDMARERGLIRTGVEVTYGNPDPITGQKDYVYVTNTVLEPIYGDRREQLDTQLLYRIGAEGHGSRFLQDHADLYHAPDVTLIMSRVSGAEADDILTLDDDYPVRITPMPESFPMTTYDADVIGFTDIMHQDDYRIILHLSPGQAAGDEDDGNWIEDGGITGGDATGTYVADTAVWRWHSFAEGTTATLDVGTGIDVVGQLLAVAGGGGGGSGVTSYEGGGGGAGAMFYGPILLSSGDSWAPIVGAGGTGSGGGFAGSDGTQSEFGDLIVYGGGGGGSGNGPNETGRAGGYGGGGGVPDGIGGGGLYGSFDAGATTDTTTIYGGNGANGGLGGGTSDGGGASLTSTITGTSVVYAIRGKSGWTGPAGVGGATPGSGGNGGTYLFGGGGAGADGSVIVAYRISPYAAYTIEYDTTETYDTATYNYGGA